MNSELFIRQLSRTVSLYAGQSGLRIVQSPAGTLDLTVPGAWKKVGHTDTGATSLLSVIPQLLEMQLAEKDQDSIRIPYAGFAEVEQKEFDFLNGLFHVAPFSISVKAKGAMGLPGFMFDISFWAGSRQAFPERYGAIIKRAQSIKRLATPVYEIISRIDEFNSLGDSEKNLQEALRVVHLIKSQAGFEISLDPYLKSETVIIPSKVSVGIHTYDDDSISLYPIFPGVDEELTRNHFLQLNDIDPVLSLNSSNLGVVRVLLSNEMQVALHDLQKARRLKGQLRIRVLTDLHSVFSDGIDQDILDITGFSPRVYGIGDLPFRARVSFNNFPQDWFALEEKSDTALMPDVTLNLKTENGTAEVQFDSVADVKGFYDEVIQAQGRGDSAVEFKGHSIIIDDFLLKDLSEVAGHENKIYSPQDDTPERKGRYLLVRQNEESAEYAEGDSTVSEIEDISGQYDTIAPQALLPYVELKKHQIDGVAWLKQLHQMRTYRKGGILADDMGLGKTLQILVFLASLIEDPNNDFLAASFPPWDPILIVAPPILLENWVNEIERYFAPGIFQPLTLLHGSTIKKFRVETRKGKELELAVPLLNLEMIRENRVVVTNYDTVKNYQHSFGRIQWSVVVCDEAQEIKTPGSQKSEALKAMNARFKIAATGTPVENRLLDLWNLMDFIQPGPLLGSAKEFSSKYESDSSSATEADQENPLEDLRTRLRYGKSAAYIVRRLKEQVLQDSFAPKEEKIVTCHLSGQQLERQKHLLQAIENSAQASHPLEVLQSLRKLSMHIRIYHGDYAGCEAKTLLAESPKLQKLVEILRDIASRKEKALIFSDSIAMQQIMQQVISEEFSLEVDVINGGGGAGKQYSVAHRNKLIERFSNRPGFHVLILSPHVAGVGLTITAANHVIHYSRWWNPAKEMQATDRAYRIGQEKPVTVYYLISRVEGGKFPTFEEKLHELIDRKKALAKDFLRPLPSESEVQAELIGTLKREGVAFPREATEISNQKDMMQLDPFEFEAFLSCYYEQRGYVSILTPATNDRGVDLLAINKTEVLIVQAKHTISSKFHLKPEALDETIEGFDFYCSELLKDINLSKKPLIATNGDLGWGDRSKIAKKDILILDGREILALLKKTPILTKDVMRAHSERPKDLVDVARLVRNRAFGVL